MRRRTHPMLMASLVLSLATGLIAGRLTVEPDLRLPPRDLPQPLVPEPSGGRWCLPKAGQVMLPILEGDALRFHPVVVTGYTSSPRETDSTPFLTASMTRVRPGCLALSRDLLRTFTPGAPFDFGDSVVLPGVGIFIVEDTMHARWRQRADIWFPSRRQAVRWGRRKAYMARLPLPFSEEQDLFALGVRSEPRH